MDAKFDNFDSKLDSNFKHLNLKLDQLFHPQQKVSEKKT